MNRVSYIISIPGLLWVLQRQREITQMLLQRRTIIAAAAGLLFLAVAPALAADSVTPNYTARFLARMAPAANSTLAP